MIAAHVSTGSRDTICPVIRISNCPAKVDPRCADKNSLSTNGVDVLVFNASKETRPKARANDDRVRRSRIGGIREGTCTSFKHLFNVLHRCTYDHSSTFRETTCQVSQVIRSVNGNRVERHPCGGIEWQRCWIMDFVLF